MELNVKRSNVNPPEARTSRRCFLRAVAGAAGAAGVGAVAVRSLAAQAAAPASQQTPLLRLGGPIFDAPQDPEGLALAHRKLGYRAAYCPNVSLNDRQRIGDISKAFAKHDVTLAEVGRWCNLLDSDPAKRAANLKAVAEGLALAEAIGACDCVDIAGSFNATSWFGPHPKNLSKDFFDAAVENARKIIDSVRPTRAKFCYEMMGWSLPDNPDSYVAMVKAVDRAAFGVHVDVCNIINSPTKFYNNTAVINECFDKLGKWIVSCHAKDLTWDVEMNIHFREVRPGAGSLDYPTYMRRVAALPGEVPLMLEHLSGAEEYDKAREYIMATGGKAGVRFE
jgi:sugar phosphate isomerase/epimerase